MMELSCECGNETEWSEWATVGFIVDGEGNREEKISEKIEYFCEACGDHAETVDVI